MAGGGGGELSVARALEFDAESHAYFFAGRPVPGVTTVLESVGIIDYSMIPEGARMMALERGRFVHSLCQFNDEGELEESTVDERLVGYLGAWLRFRDDTKFEPSLIEHRGYCATYAYAGTLDRSGLMPGKSDILLDLKTTCAPYWTAYQTAAYANFFEKPARFRRMAVELHADTTYKIHEYRCADFSRDLNIFLAALTCHGAKENR